MPKRLDIKKILIIGAGPIIIGQGCEFDYSGTQALKALKEEGYEVVLVNSNPATIMTDPILSDQVYIEPVTKETVELIIMKERPEALLPTVGGQTALNIAVELSESGVLEKYGVELIGAKIEAINKAEDRELFKEAMSEIGLKSAKSRLANNVEEALEALNDIPLPVIIRPAFTLGGSGGSIAKSKAEYLSGVKLGLELSPKSQVLIEESIAGYKEFELEAIRDLNDNVIIICSIENFEPMGIHTGDSLTVAPAQTLSDKEYQKMRDAAIKIIRKIGVETGGSNIQFAVNPEDGDLVVVEMNPRVSRSSALASKATGFPIAKIAAKLSVGLSLDEIENEITKETLAAFEPALDYVVTKIPRFDFDKFPSADSRLGSQMKSVGEVMSIGSNFRESLQKGLRSLEIDISGLDEVDISDDELRLRLKEVRANNILAVGEALRRGWSIETIYELSKIDRWFLKEIALIVKLESTTSLETINDDKFLRLLKENGCSDKRIAKLLDLDEDDIRALRLSKKINPIFKRIDTCAGEFSASTPYMYSTYKQECESDPTDKKKIMILGGGPNRIGQGIEFDYCAVHAVMALKSSGYETIMVNCNPETVSTDYDIADRLYFEPLTFEDLTEIIAIEEPDGVIVQLGGQTPLNLSMRLKEWGANIIGSDPMMIARAEDRKSFKELIENLSLLQTPSEIALRGEDAKSIANKIGYPIIARPSYVLGGRAMEILYQECELDNYLANLEDKYLAKPLLIDKFLDDAIELDVDALSDGTDVIIGGILEHIEAAGIHSGDSSASLPAMSISDKVYELIKEQTTKIALELNVIGLINIQFAIQSGKLYVIEVNPRASRTVPFISKATGLLLAKEAALIISGKSIKELNLKENKFTKSIAIKESVFPFNKFKNVDTILGPEMKSTGEVMGIDNDFGRAFLKATLAAGHKLPTSGSIFISVADSDKERALFLGLEFEKLGFSLMATAGTANMLRTKNIKVESLLKVKDGTPNCVDKINQGEIDMIINTTFGAQSILDSFSIRRAALMNNIAYQTTIEGAKATLSAIKSILVDNLSVNSITSYY